MVSVCSNGQHDQCTGIKGFNSFGCGNAKKDGIFSSWVEDDALGLKRKHIGFIRFLPIGIKINGNGIDAFKCLLFRTYVYAIDLEFIPANGFNRMACHGQLFYDQMAVLQWIG